MSTGAGGAGLGTANIQVLTQGAVELPNGAQVNVTTAEGMAQAGEVLDQNGLAELKALCPRRVISLKVVSSYRTINLLRDKAPWTRVRKTSI